MLDSLNSTLTRSTIAGFFTRFGKDSWHDELTFDEAVQCLEGELGRPQSERRRIADDEGEGEGVGTPMVISRNGDGGEPLELEKLNFSGPPAHSRGEIVQVTEPAQQPLVKFTEPRRQASDSSYEDSDEGEGEGEGESSGGNGSGSGSGNGSGNGTSGDVSPAPVVSASGTGGKRFKKARFRRKGPTSPKSKKGPITPGVDDSFERLINVRSCPLCHRPRMNDRAEVDIVTHLAVCASQDWNKVDRIVVGNFVTASQAQRKWYTRVLEKVSGGGYRLGAVCFFVLPSFFGGG